VALLAAVLTAFAAAPAAAWIELPAHPVAGDGVADCLRAAGPGQLALLGGDGRSSSPVDLLTVGPQAIAPGTDAALGRLAACPELAGAPGATPLLTAAVAHGVHSELTSVRVADAGSPAVTIGTSTGFDSAPSVAVSPSGAAVIAWTQSELRPFPGVTHVLAATRPAAGAPFGPVVTLGTGSPFGMQPSAAIDASGHATVVWVSHSSLGGAATIDIADAAAGGRLVTRQLASAAGDQVALAVSPAGRTLVVDSGSDSILAYERTAGASTFAPVPAPSSSSPDELAVALADDGGAVIAYRVDSSLGGVGSAVSAFALLRRPGDAAFGREQVLEGSSDNGSFSAFGFMPSIDTSSSPLPDDRGAQIAAALNASGRVLLTWVDPGTRGSAASAHVASGTLAGGMARPARFGSPCRTANAAQPLTLADGTLGAAWTDNARVTARARSDTPLSGGLLHALLPGRAAVSADAPPPGVSARLTGATALHGGQPIRLRVRCRRGPCIVRAAATAYPLSRFGDPTLVDGSIDLQRGRTGVLALDPADGSTLARPHDATAPVSVLACAPAGTRAAHLTLKLRLHRLRLLPVPRVVDLVARRHGSKIDVTWRTSIPARDTRFDVIAQPFNLAHPVYAEVAGHGRSRFSTTLHLAPGVHERTISVRVNTAEQPFGTSVTARIR